MRLTIDDFIVILFCLIGFFGTVVLYLYKFPPIIIAFFLATGVAAFVYRFLGGITGASLAVGALKLTGTLAALVGLALLINSKLEKSMGFRPLEEADMVGEWRWVYGRGGWTGTLNFVNDQGKLRFDGLEQECTNNKCEDLYALTNGTAHVSQGNLDLEADVQDKKYNDNFHLKNAVPFQPIWGFRGNLRRNGDTNPGHVWGMMLYKSSGSE
jgi:hypothetical protein